MEKMKKKQKLKNIKRERGGRFFTQGNRHFLQEEMFDDFFGIWRLLGRLNNG